MRSSGILVTFALGLSLAIAPAGSVAGEGCAADNCHADKTSAKWVHGPVGAGLCSICHQVEDEKEHQFSLVAEDEVLCFACHDSSRDMMLEDYVHTPVAGGECIECHDPHGSPYRYALKGEAADLCFQCHDQADFQDTMVHGPVEQKDCNICHNPHGSAHAKQLREEPVALCIGCHDEQSMSASVRHPHLPVVDSCVNCHSPHASSGNFLLDEPAPGLCINCHTAFSDYMEVSHPHAPVQNGQCTKCHAVHGSNYPKLFAVAPQNLCATCHGEFGEFVSTQAHQHGPVQEGDCNACHNPHGSENHRILRAYFPEEFYTPYEESKYAICFQCHSHDIALSEETETLTGFRDGERNLHFLHVNKDVKGRSCRACHQVHASNQEKHIRESVPYGSMDWELPVEYTRKENGGNCVVGCHSPKGYAR
jgi:predicted CXXCH cytochrome family protein